ncbi:DMT family transporter [archaeon]|nr:DMT family transporter [archaeon]
MKPEIAILGIVIILLWGIWGFLYKYGVTRLGLLSTLLATSIFYSVLNVLIIGYLYKRGVGLPLEGTTAILLTGTAAGVTASILFLYALTKYPGSVVIPLTALYPAVSVVLAILILKEDINRLNGIGIVLAVIAGYLLSR